MPGPDGNTIDVQVLRPPGANALLPGVLYIHGGGFAYGELDGPSPMAADVCAEVGAVVVNVHYRLAPEHRFPGDAGSMRRVTDRRIVNGPGSRHTWDTYLGADRGDDASPYAAPAWAADLSGLPPAYVLTCGLDPMRDDGHDYALRLMRADVPVELKDVPGAWHFFEAFAPHTALARQTTAHWLGALRTALHRH